MCTPNQSAVDQSGLSFSAQWRFILHDCYRSGFREEGENRNKDDPLNSRKIRDKIYHVLRTNLAVSIKEMNFKVTKPWHTH